MSSKETYVFQVFQTIAPGYDRANDRISLGAHSRWKRSAARWLLHRLPLRPEILDLGCGTGDMLKQFFQLRPGCQLTGLDFSPNMLSVAEKNCKNIPNLVLAQGNACQVPFPDGRFDAVSISFALRNTADYLQVLREALRVLKPGGYFLCIDSFVPENVLVRPFYHLYFSSLMPLLGGGLANWKEYRWLRKSTNAFLSTGELMELMEHAGFCKWDRHYFMFGACACVTGQKPLEKKA